MTIPSSLENIKLKKWLEILPNLELYIKNKRKSLKQKIRKGIPDSLRGEIWYKISGTENIYRDNLYNEYIYLLKENEMKVPDEKVIIKDLNRTFPRNLLFINILGEGQRTLFRILCCLSMKNKRVGYVQGMAFLVGIFFSYLNEEKSFWMMENLLKNYHLQEIYLPGFPGLKKNFFVLLKLMKKLLPNLFQKFLEYKVYPAVYASPWYLTCFTNTLPYNIVVRIIDCFLFEGTKIIHRISLGLLALKENEIVAKKDFLDIMDVLKVIADNINMDLLFKKSFDFSISKKTIKKYENIYKELSTGKITGNEDIMDLIKT